MTPAMWLEVWGSLTLQVTLLVCAVSWVARRSNSGTGDDWLWATLHVVILLLTAAAFLLPHLRPITLAEFGRTVDSAAVQDVCHAAGNLCKWLWMLGTAAVVFAMIGGMNWAARLVRQAVPHAELTLLARQTPLAAGPRLSTLEVRVSSFCVSPFCWQFHHPVVVVPDLLLDFPRGEQVAVLQHELAHLRAQHPLHLFLQRLVEAVYWYLPLVWWSSRQSGAAREFRCDRDAVASRQEVAVYLRSLLRLIESPIAPPNNLPAGLGFLGDSSLLSRRAAVLTELAGQPVAEANSRRPATLLLAAVALSVVAWLPINPHASRRGLWSPWPTWSAHALNVTGIHVRDYEIDGHRLRPHEHTYQLTRPPARAACTRCSVGQSPPGSACS